MEAHHKNFDPTGPTCDGIIVGDPSKECTGVALTRCPTARVIRQAADQGCNLLLCHEPTFFDGWDKTDWLEGDPVYLAKKALLEETGMAVYRNHDHLHSDRPDGIFTGVVKKLGWEKYALGDEFMPGCCFQLPTTTVDSLCRRYEELDVHQDSILEGYHILHDKAGVKRRKNVPSSENLIKMLLKHQSIPFINQVVDIYNVISMESRLCVAAHNLDKVDGNLTVRFSDGTETYLALGAEQPVPMKPHEYCYAGRHV